MTTNRILLCAALACAAVFLFVGNANAMNSAQVEAQPSGTAVTVDSNPVISYLASVAGASLDGYTYTNWAIIATDSSGSLEYFGHLPVGSAYVPTVGDALSVSGTYSPFHQIPEVETLTAISATSSGNTPASPVVVTIPALNAMDVNPPTTDDYGILEYLVELDNVTLSGASTFAFNANTTLTATDSSSNTVTVYQYASSYSAAGAFGGQPVPTGPVDIIGIADVFSAGSGGTEVIPFQITSVPEPCTFVLGGLGLLGLLATKKLRRK
jgi:hypothetical protein